MADISNSQIVGEVLSNTDSKNNEIHGSKSPVLQLPQPCKSKANLQRVLPKRQQPMREGRQVIQSSRPQQDYRGPVTLAMCSGSMSSQVTALDRYSAYAAAAESKKLNSLYDGSGDMRIVKETCDYTVNRPTTPTMFIPAFLSKTQKKKRVKDVYADNRPKQQPPSGHKPSAYINRQTKQQEIQHVNRIIAKKILNVKSTIPKQRR